MEEEIIHTDSSLHTATTSWTIGDGSLLHTITFESSSLSSTSGNETIDENDDVESPLVLFPSSPDLNPCEITITFKQTHELRQVYVLSTAKVFEIYYATKVQQSNEYLCTVRCGVAARDEEVLHTTSTEDPEETVEDERRVKNESNTNVSEDDWVEVKAADTSLLVSKHNFPSSDSIVSPQQDLYEATAEITDTDPCISITLRLLSLEDKGCLIVGQIYVFADPADLPESENQVSAIGTSGSTSLMAMLVPTLLQFSKTRDVSRIQASNMSEKQNAQEIHVKENESTNAVKQERLTNVADPEEVNLQSADSVNLQAFVQIPSTEGKPDPKPSCCHVGIVVDQLVSQVSRIEDILSRFEERMLKPINSIDTRLQQVEQKLEELTKKSQNFDLLGTRTCAPEYSCSGSDYNSSYCASKTETCNLEPLESSKEDCWGPNVPNPSLVMTAPDFTFSEEEESHSGAKISSKDETKHSLSIDDALASALAGFLSSSVNKRQTYSQALVVKAPDFANEEDEDDKTTHQTKLKEINSSSCLDAIKETSYARDSNVSFEEREGEATKILDDSSEKVTNGVHEHYQQNERGKGDSIPIIKDLTVNSDRYDEAKDDSFSAKEIVESCQGTIKKSVYCDAEILNQPLRDMTETDSLMSRDAAEIGEVSEANIKSCMVNETEIPNQLLEEVTNVGSYSHHEILRSASDVTQGSTNDNIHTVLEFPHSSSLVDFEIPILDVKFNSFRNSESTINCFLDDLLDSNVKSPAIVDSKQHDLISLQEEELTGPPTDTLLSLDMQYYDHNFCLEGEKQPDSYASSNQEIHAGSLI